MLNILLPDFYIPYSRMSCLCFWIEATAAHLPTLRPFAKNGSKV